jgi:4-amino-4-deoxy-L-arabinose transferase-like glycosyltransferase
MEPVKAKFRLSSRAGGAGYACARAMTSRQFAPALLVTILGCELGLLFFQAGRKLFWFDELLTFHVSSLQPFSLFWRALKAGVDGMPLGYYLFVRVARMLPGDPLITLRLPSILGYLLTLLGVYWFARKRLPAFAGLAAVLLITLSPFRAYALEARSYSLFVGFLAISAVFWQRIGEKRFMTPLFALFLTLAVSSHYLAVVAISAFGVAELTWTFLSRRIRWGVWAALLLATFPFFVNLPILLHFRDIFGENYWSRPNRHTAILTYGTYLGLGSNLAHVLIAFFGIVVGFGIVVWRFTPTDVADHPRRIS